MPSPALRSAPRDQRANPGRNDVLRRCAEDDPNCLHDLEAAFGDQVRAVLARALGSAEIAAFALPAVLADLRERAGAFNPELQPADDWVFGQVRARLRDLTRATVQLATASKPWSAKQVPSPLRFPAFRLGQPSGVKLRAVRAPVAAAGERPDPGLPACVVGQVRAAPVHLPVRRRRRQRRWLRRVAVAAAAAVVVVVGAGIGSLIPPERSNIPQLATVPTRAPDASIPARPTTAAAPIQEPPAPAPLQTAEPLPHPISTPLVASAMRGSLEPASQPGVQTKYGAAAALPQEAIGPGTMPADPVLSMPRPPAPPITATERPPIRGGRAAAGPVAQEEGSGAVPVPQATAQSRATPEPVPPNARPAAPVLYPHRAPPLVAATSADPAASSSPTRVFIHHTAGSNSDAAGARAVAERLRREGFEVVAVRRVPFAIRTGSVRYYFEHDRSAARRLADLSGPLAGSGRKRPPLDFSHYRPKPSPGTVEVWIESR